MDTNDCGATTLGIGEQHISASESENEDNVNESEMMSAIDGKSNFHRSK